MILGVTEITAFILAGGKSTRMGRDKAFLELGGFTLLSRAMDLAGTVTAEVRIVGDSQKIAPFGRIVEDVYRDCGPLGGIHAALASTSTELNLMLAVDLPFLTSKFLDFLISRAQKSRALIVVPRAAGGWQPLCAVYRRDFASIAEPSLKEGKNKVDALFSPSHTEVIEEEDLLRRGFSSEIFRNLNTPEEWAVAQAKLDGSPQP